ncbi:DinB family protein [Solwaraspora sp. WMMD791]|uniref:DinB family protein n=1 Tax=Solwaraspora sp. WMMD791 TaxID=3016086 RepID=UPI00249B767E|nr:DinB family protein [Solwaraspora sp. WMMD791]WFE25835.1 DinB family protein [Solwaraspora sp. WMMD791]
MPSARAALLSWHVEGRPPHDRTEIHWPGSGEPTVRWLRELRADWTAALGRSTDTDLDRVVAYPWPADAGSDRPTS